MPMAQINARNNLDTSLRYWGIGIDKIPTGNWLKDADIVKAQRYQGDLWQPELNMSDGKHVLYFIVSQTDPSRGGYDGDAVIGEAGFNFKGIDNDTAARMPVIVAGGKIKRDSSSSHAEGKDIPENAFSGGFAGAGGRLKASLSSLRNMTAETRNRIAIGAGITVVGGIIVAICYKTWKKRKRF